MLTAVTMSSIIKFQFTLPVWGARLSISVMMTIRAFQFTLPVWGARPIVIDWETMVLFQFTLPVWGAPSTNKNTMSNTATFQFTLPVWGARTYGLGRWGAGMFQFTLPVWGARKALYAGAATAGFNSRSPYGEHCLFLNKHILKFRFVKSANLKLLKDFLRNTYRETISFFSCRC